jgi:hypothetical protein
MDYSSFPVRITSFMIKTLSRNFPVKSRHSHEDCPALENFSLHAETLPKKRPEGRDTGDKRKGSKKLHHLAICLTYIGPQEEEVSRNRGSARKCAKGKTRQFNGRGASNASLGSAGIRDIGFSRIPRP